MHMFSLSILLLFFLIKIISAQTIINGQIFIPGIAIVDSPQPNTPEGGGKNEFTVTGELLLISSRFLAGCARCIS